MFNTGIIARLRLFRTLRSARALTAAGKLDEAKAAFDLALRIRPQSREAASGLSELLLVSGRPFEAEAVLKRLSDSDGGHPSRVKLLPGGGAQQAAEHDRQITALADRLGQALQHLTSLKAISFELQNRKVTFDALGQQTQVLIEASSRHDNQIRYLGENIGRALENLTAVKAIGFELKNRRHAVEDLERDLKAASRTTSLHDREIGLLHEKLEALAAQRADREAVDSELLKQKERYEELRAKIAQAHARIDDQLPNVAAVEAAEGRLSRLERAFGALDAKASMAEQKWIEAGHEAAARFSSQLERLENQLAEARHERDRISAQTQAISEAQSYVVGRVEFVRREVMYEMYHGKSYLTLEGEGLKAEAKIVSRDKVKDQSSSGLRLNLGCGHIPLEGYVNVDRRELPHIDIVAEVDDLPVEAGTVSEIRSAHLLEHFPQEELIRRILPYWKSLLRGGGVFSAVVPDGQAMMEKWVGEDYPFEALREAMYGSQEYSGDYHYNVFTPESLSAILFDAGFQSVQVVEKARRNGLCFEFEVKAENPPTALVSNNVRGVGGRDSMPVQHDE